jgi:hypothetical protein
MASRHEVTAAASDTVPAPKGDNCKVSPHDLFLTGRRFSRDQLSSAIKSNCGKADYPSDTSDTVFSVLFDDVRHTVRTRRFTDGPTTYYEIISVIPKRLRGGADLVGGKPRVIVPNDKQKSILEQAREDLRRAQAAPPSILHHQWHLIVALLT